MITIDKFSALLTLIVPEVIDLIIQNYKQTELEATESFYNSKTYELLEDEPTKIWHFSPLTLFNIFDSEQKTGELDLPEEI